MTAPRPSSPAIAPGTLAAVLIAAAAAPAVAQPAGFTRSQGIGVEETSGTTLTDFQVRLQIDTRALIAAGTLRRDAGDLRFTTADCSTTILPHWIESGIDTATTVVWVRVPSLPAGATTRLVMWHGNPSAPATSSARAVFIGAGGANEPISSTGYIATGNTGGAANSQRGFRFRPNVPVLLVELGKREPNGTTRTVTLFDMASRAIVRQQAVAGAAGSYGYGAVAQPVWLSPDVEYVLQVFQGPTDGYYFGPSSQIAADLTYLDMRYCNDCTASTFPTAVLANQHYGYPDLRYFKRRVATSAPIQVTVGGTCVETATCDSDCTPAACGDGVVNTAAREMCDDGNRVDTDACRNSCAPATCGDGVVQLGVEQCDDGNLDDSDTCLATCVAARCGDGIVRAGVEACDDGNADDGDDCLRGCVVPRCGDGVVHAGVEECDDGNPFDDDDCRPDCTAVLIADCCCAAGRGGPRALAGTALLAVAVLGRLRRRRPPAPGPSRRSPPR